jgi:hypothetical protein
MQDRGDEEKNNLEDIINSPKYLEEAMFNAYLLLTDQLSMGDLEDEIGFWLPQVEDEESLIKEILSYYESQEEYEKCQDIKELVDSGKCLTTLKNMVNYTKW